jgi:hypothetical protein
MSNDKDELTMMEELFVMALPFLFLFGFYKMVNYFYKLCMDKKENSFTDILMSIGICAIIIISIIVFIIFCFLFLAIIMSI